MSFVEKNYNRILTPGYNAILAKAEIYLKILIE